MNSGDDKEKAGTKRAMISKDSQVVLIWAIAASIIFSACAVLSWSFIEDITYNGKVIGELNSTNKALKDNKSASDTIKTELGKLNDDENLIQLRASTDDSALQVVLDALPTVDNRASLAASLQDEILTPSRSDNVSLQNINMNDASSSENRTTTGGKTVSGPQPIDFSFVLLGDEAAIQKALKNIERTIRPIVVTNMTINSGNELRVTIGARTYYNPLMLYSLADKKVER
jgi:hypothetical protein